MTMTPYPDEATPDPLLTSRRTTWRVDLLDRTDRLKGRLAGVTGGSVEVNVNRAVYGSGSLVIQATGAADDGEVTAADIDWASDRVRIWWEVEGVDPWPLATMLLDRVVRREAMTGTTYHVDLLDKLTILSQEGMGTIAYPSGAHPVDVAVALIEGAGETAIAATDSDAALTTGLAWPSQDSPTRLRIINDLLAAAGYRGVYCDGLGVYRLEPYVRPQDRAPVWAFAEGELAVHSPDWERTQDGHDVINRLRCLSQASGEDEPLEVVVENSNPASPYSIPSRGRVLSRTDTGIEATSLAALASIAQQRLLAASSPTATLAITHAPLPLPVHARVDFESQGHSAQGVITSQSLTLAATAQVTARIQEVVPT